jgi:DNA invertase Pin-like site-specific DNA recombinase
MKMTAIYMRVSSKTQDMAAQEPDLKRWAEAHGEQAVWYRDTFIGKSMDRPGWTKLMGDIQNGKVGKVVVWRLDRLGRTAKGLTALFDELMTKKVNLISLKDGIDLHTAAGRLMANVLASVAQYETEVRAERVRAGQDAAKKKGVTWGGSVKGWHWRVTDDQVSAINEMKAAGKKITQIARVTGLSRPTIYRVLDEPVLPPKR